MHFINTNTIILYTDVDHLPSRCQVAAGGGTAARAVQDGPDGDSARASSRSGGFRSFRT